MRIRLWWGAAAIASACSCLLACGGVADTPPDGGGAAQRPPGATGGGEPSSLHRQHASCSLPFPKLAPELPAVDTDATGRPLFDHWRDLTCASAAASCGGSDVTDCSPCSHARACCEGLRGFDCRAWPFGGTSAPGMVCATHADCEPGLVCAAPAGGKGYGVCQCPGANAEQPNDCAYLLENEAR